MIKSSIIYDGQGGAPRLMLDGRIQDAMAYTTYFEERSHAEDFVRAGYRIFFVNIAFTASPINSSYTGFTPFRTGVFEDPDSPDFSEFENAVERILSACPEAYIFPRIYVSMPKWWVKENPEEVIPTPKGGYREALFSEKFRRDGGELLQRIVRHIMGAPYSERVAGWQICGGQTQEWFHHDSNGSLHPAAEKYYREWVKDTYGEDGAKLPSHDDYKYTGTAVQTSEEAARYSIFCNLGVARSVEHFASVIKREVGRDQIVGTFYGYSFESCSTVLNGSHALRAIIDSPSIDFFSSPNAYTLARAFGIDWADMMPVDSIRRHGKLCFIECDIRTHKTTSIQEARPGVYPDDIYKTTGGASVWQGPPTAELAREALRKCFAHQVTHGSAIWWFDMWGGWYDEPLLMAELTEMKRIHSSDCRANGAPTAELVFFADERGYSRLYTRSPELLAITNSRTAIGTIGVPYDICMAEDARDVLKHYRAAVFPMPAASEAGRSAMELCERMKIPYITATAEHPELSRAELRAFAEAAGLNLFADEGEVVYLGQGYLALHSKVGGEKTLKLPKKYKVTPVFGVNAQESVTDRVEFTLSENATALFKIEDEAK